MRLAEEYDAAQDRGEVSKGGGRPDCVADYNAVPVTAADLGIRRDEIHEARQFRDAERADPGIIDRAISGMMNTLIVFQRMGAWLRRDGALWHLSGFAKQYARARGSHPKSPGSPWSPVPGRGAGCSRAGCCASRLRAFGGGASCSFSAGKSFKEDQRRPFRSGNHPACTAARLPAPRLPRAGRWRWKGRRKARAAQRQPLRRRARYAAPGQAERL